MGYGRKGISKLTHDGFARVGTKVGGCQPYFRVNCQLGEVLDLDQIDDVAWQILGFFRSLKSPSPL